MTSILWKTNAPCRRYASNFSLCSSSFFGRNSTSTSSSATATAQLVDLLLVASIDKALGGARNLDVDLESVPLSESLVLQVLRRNSLDATRKLRFFRWCSVKPGYSHSAPVYSQIFRIVCRDGCLSEVPNLLTSMKRDGVVLDSDTFKIILDSFIRLGEFDSALELLDQLEEEKLGISGCLNARVYSSVLIALIRKHQLGLALSICFKLLDTSNGNGNDIGVAPDAIACNELLVALRREGMKAEFRKVFDKLRESKCFELDMWGYNICIHALGCWGDLATSLGLFREMKDLGLDPDLCTYNSLIHVLCLVGKVKDAIAVWEELKGSGHEPGAFTYRILIQGCAKSYLIDDAAKIFSEMQYNGFRPDTVVYNSLLNGLLKARKLTEACQLFEKMVEDGVRASCWTHNILIDGLFKNGRAAVAFSLFCDLKKKGQFVDGVTYSIVVLQLCNEGQIEEALQLVEEMEVRGFAVDLITVTSLLIGLHRQGRWEWTDRLMKHIRDGNLLPTVLKWKADMEASVKNPQNKRKDFTHMFPSVGDVDDIISAVSSGGFGADARLGSKDDELQDEHILQDDINQWSSSPYLDQLAKQVNSKNQLYSLFSLFKGKRVQAKGMDSFDTDMMNTYLSIFLAKGKLSLACKLFEIFTNSGVNPVSYTYNSMMSSFVKKGYFSEAWGVLQEMGETFCPADIATYNVIIQGLGKMQRADLASDILDRLMKHGGYLDIVMYNTLINALGKGGRIDEANKLFEQMTASGINPDVVTYNTLIDIHSKAGRLKDAYKFLKMMLNAGCSPNDVTDTTLDFLEKEIEKLRYQKASIRGTNKGHTS